MKKFIYSLFVLAIAAMTFSGCEDVPAPYNLPQEIIDGGDGETTADPMGTGTETDPYNVAAANQVGATLSAGESTETVYIRGIVSRIDEIDPSFGNATYCISDDGTPNNQFLVYRGYSLGGEKFTSVDELKVGDEVIVKGTITNYNGTIELNQRNEIYSLNGVIAGGETGEGEGTLESPYNVAKALSLIANGENNPDAEVYIKGKVSQIKEVSAQFGNATYWISDDGSTDNQLYVFRGKYLNGEEFTSEDQLKVGDEVVILGKLTTFNDDPQVGTGSKLVSVNGQTGMIPGTEALPYTPSQALEVIANGENDPEAEVYIKGKVSQIKEVSPSFGNATYYISDDGTTDNQLYVFRGKYLNGDKFTSEDQLKVGDEVVILGKLTTYNGDPQVNTGSSIVSINGNGGGSTGGGAISISDNMLTLTNSAVTAGTETATLNVADITGLKRGDKPSSLTMSDGSVITFDANGETNAPAYHETDMRVYKNNIMRFSCKKTIAKIVITCSADDRVGNETATVSFNGNEAEYNNVFTGTSGGGVQLRITNIVVTYAK
ncbi:MAG: hypothetical protein UFJ02_01060 [Prevotella sp.]|nr:hypothetical protein [Prevotella sp.]